MSDNGHRRYELLRNVLHEHLQQHIRDVAAGTEPGRSGGQSESLHGPVATARRELAEVVQALQRIAESTYGICEDCRGPIPLGRLRLVPHARFCVPCHQHRPPQSPAGRPAPHGSTP